MKIFFGVVSYIDLLFTSVRAFFSFFTYFLKVMVVKFQNYATLLFVVGLKYFGKIRIKIFKMAVWWQFEYWYLHDLGLKCIFE